MSLQTLSADITVIGGGASGITAAITAARTSHGKLKIIIAEQLPRTGKKLLATGNGRCNLANININKSFYHGSLTNIAFDVMGRFGFYESFFRSIGLLCRHDNEGRVYPLSNSAASVLDALRLELHRLGITELCSCKIDNISKIGDEFILQSSDTTIKSKRVIVSTGGCSAPDLGSDGSMFPILKRLGHTLIPAMPSLAPIKTEPALVKPLKGVRVYAKASAVLNGKILKSECGEVQFSDSSLSGICIFNLSRLAAAYKDNLSISLDLMPDYSENELKNILHEIAGIRRSDTLENYLTGMFHKRVAQTIIKYASEKQLSLPVSSLSEKDLTAVCKLIKNFVFPVKGISQWNSSQVTCGGISGNELTENLESTIVNGLYITGEAADIDGDCGGFNLFWAWSSGLCAGTYAAKSLENNYDKN